MYGRDKKHFGRLYTYLEVLSLAVFRTVMLVNSPKRQLLLILSIFNGSVSQREDRRHAHSICADLWLQELRPLPRETRVVLSVLDLTLPDVYQLPRGTSANYDLSCLIAFSNPTLSPPVIGRGFPETIYCSGLGPRTTRSCFARREGTPIPSSPIEQSRVALGKAVLVG